MASWARRHPHTLFVVDEAYQAFVPGLDSLLSVRAGNLLILRSMTKDYALAGLRIGYAVDSDDVIAALLRVRPPWSVNSMAQAAALAALRDEAHLAQSLRNLHRAKQDFVAALAERGLEVLPSATHYFLVRVKEAAAFRLNLLHRGIHVHAATSVGCRFIRWRRGSPAKYAAVERFVGGILVMRLLLATHAETEWNAQGRYQGHTDIPLHERGHRQAEGLRERLAREPLQAVIASDLCRARQTAEIVAAPHGLAVASEPRLRELSFGQWEGQSHADVQRTDPIALAAWRADPLRFHPPGGESMAELAARLQAFLDDLSASTDDAVLLVGHRGAMRVLLCLLLSVAVERQWDFHLDIASLTEVTWIDGPTTLVRLNE